MSTLLAILSALPKIVALFQLVAGMVRDREQRGLGRKEAIAEALTIAHRDIAAADAAEAEASTAHAHDSTDAAFDQSFQRKD